MSAFNTLFSQYERETLIEVKQLDNRRQLVFDGSIIQSEILLDQPKHLALNLHQYFLAGHLFSPHPKRVLLAGLGGGALARYFINRFPDTHGDAAEISPLVCKLAPKWFELTNSTQWQIHCEAIQDYAANTQQTYDCMIIDIAEGDYSPQWLTNRTLLTQLKQLLTPKGHIAFNLLPKDASHLTDMIKAIRQIFKDSTACLTVPDSGNIVMYAYREKPFVVLNEIQEEVEVLKQSWGLPLNQLLTQMQRENPKGSGVF